MAKRAAGQDLFDHRRERETEAHAPLADRMRPRSLDEFFGQDHIVGPGRLLRRAIEADQLSSLIFYGPPGTGKTTLARIIANTTEAHFVALNAVLSGVRDIRGAIEEAKERRGMYGQRTILFVDEVHRFNKAQQDALLPWVENGMVILVGATTENPYFEVNKALVSRSRIFQLVPLTNDDLRAVALACLSDDERGYGSLDVELEERALDHLISVAGGDARGVLNALELAVETTSPDDAGRIRIGLEVAEESIQKRAVLYDKEGDAHYDTISAFIKSLRGSDPDASLYWLARMVYAGEDPRFIFRRMLILASEDVGLADPNAVAVVVSCARAYDYVGLPEGRFHLSQAVLYLATAPKSNSTMAFFDALDTVESQRGGEVPAHLKDANRDGAGFGHGQGYLYPHAYRDHWVAQQYLPEELQGRVFYQPGSEGAERRVRDEVMRRREAQIESMLDADPHASVEVLTNSGQDLGRERDRWLARVSGDAGERLGALRDRVIDGARLRRHDLVLDLNASTGLLTWEAARRVPEGGVWAIATDQAAADALDSYGAALGSLGAPTIVACPVSELGELLELRGEADVRFDAIVGRNALAAQNDPEVALHQARERLAPGGRLSLAEVLPGEGSRPSDLLDPDSVDSDLLERVVRAEDAAYSHGKPPPVAGRTAPLDEDALRRVVGDAGFGDAVLEVESDEGLLPVTESLVERWFGVGAPYASMLGAELSPEEIEVLRRRFAALIPGPPCAWRTTTAYVTARDNSGTSGASM